MNREKLNPIARQTFPEPLDFSTVRKLRECLAGRQMDAGYKLARRREEACLTASTTAAMYSRGDQVSMR
jgi:hypothetical protein